MDMETLTERMETLTERIGQAHAQRREEFLWDCVHKCLCKESWTLTPEIRKAGKILVSNQNRNAMAFLWRGEFVAALAWNHPAGNYQVLDYMPFPYEPSNLNF